MHLFRKVSAYLCASVILDNGNCSVCLPVEHVSICVANTKGVALYFCDCLQKAVQVIVLQNKGIRYPASTELIVLHSMAVF